MEKLNLHIKNLYEKNKENFKLLPQHIRENKKEIIIRFIAIISPLIMGFIVLMKSVLFLGILDDKNWASININYFSNIVFTSHSNAMLPPHSNVMFISHTAIIIIIISFAFLLKNKKRTYLLLGMDVLISMLFIFDLSYYRSTGTFLSLKQLIDFNLFNPINKSVINFKWIDLLFLVDIIGIIIIVYFTKNKVYESKRRIICFLATFLFSVIVLSKSNYFFNERDTDTITKNLTTKDWVESVSVENMSPLGFHAYDIYTTLKNKYNCYKLQNSNAMADIKDWINDNKENLPDNEYKGIYEGKSLVFIQVESLERMLINQTIEGQEVTPNLNKLLKNSLYFDEIYEQNGEGHSSDSDLLVNTSVLPIKNDITFFEYPGNKFTTIAKLMNEKGYDTLSTHPESDIYLGGFNWEENHGASLGFDKIYDSTKLDGNEEMGYGLSDKSYLSSVEKKISELNQPFFSWSVTVSSHGPFTYISDSKQGGNENNKYLNLSNNLSKNLLGDYCQSFRYTDEQIGQFINYVENDMNLKNTVFVIYGDHTILHKSYENRLRNIKTNETWWKDTEKRIPLIIYTPGQEAKTISTYGGQIDILPTIAYLMGIDKKEFEDTTMGRVLVNTERNSTILNDGTIKGETKDNQEENHLKNSLTIGDEFIRGNYLKWLEKN